MTTAGASPRAVLGMTLHNNARHLREATESILAQTNLNFVLLMLDDGSVDETEAIGREYERRDARVRYARQAERKGMVPTWKAVAEGAFEEFPDAPYFAWVSDHDRWHPEWLARMAAVLDADPATVLAYPVTFRIDEEGRPTEKVPRAFETAGVADVSARWRDFCSRGVGSGDMVYGLIRMTALRAAGYFRPVLNPDRLLIAELCLQGQIRQVDAPLWWRRDSAVASVARQRTTLFAGALPPRFGWPPTLQHAAVLWDEYTAANPPVALGRAELVSMLVRYQTTSLWRYFRKTETSKSLGRGVDHLHWVKKVVKKGMHHGVYYTMVGWHRLHGRSRRLGRRIVHDILVLTHRAGLRGPRGGTRTP